MDIEVSSSDSSDHVEYSDEKLFQDIAPKKRQRTSNNQDITPAKSYYRSSCR